MSQLPKEYQAIVDEIRAAALQKAKLNNLQILDQGAVRDAVERCFALANKPVRELTDGEISRIWDDGWDSPIHYAKLVIAAHQRKQREPETVTFRAARHKADNRVSMLQVIDDANIASCWELLEPAQTIEVKLP